MPTTLWNKYACTCIKQILISQHCIYVVTTYIVCNDTTSQQHCVNVVYDTTLPQRRCTVVVTLCASWEDTTHISGIINPEYYVQWGYFVCWVWKAADWIQKLKFIIRNSVNSSTPEWGGGFLSHNWWHYAIYIRDIFPYYPELYWVIYNTLRRKRPCDRCSTRE